MKLIIKGRIPSKKNSKNIVVRGGKPLIISSKRYRKWEEEHLWLLKGQDNIETPVACTLTFYAPDKRITDLSNKCESIMDLLVEARIIEDGNWFEVPKLNLVFAGVDRENPRCEVELKKLNN